MKLLNSAILMAHTYNPKVDEKNENYDNGTTKSTFTQTRKR